MHAAYMYKKWSWDQYRFTFLIRTPFILFSSWFSRFSRSLMLRPVSSSPINCLQHLKANVRYGAGVLYLSMNIVLERKLVHGCINLLVFLVADVATTAIDDVKHNMAVNFFNHTAYTIILRPTVTCCWDPLLRIFSDN